MEFDLTALRAVKNLLVPAGAKPREILAGLNKGVRIHLDLRSSFQTWVGLSERELAPWFPRFSMDAVTAVDVGAAFGFYTAYFLRQPLLKRVFAFEPSPACREALLANLELNGWNASPRLVLSDHLIGAKDGQGTTTLDSLLPQIEFPCVVKVDIEGAEIDALRGAQALLSEPGVRWIFETHNPDCHRFVREQLEKNHYCIHEIHRPWWRALIPEMRPAAFKAWITAERA